MQISNDSLPLTIGRTAGNQGLITRTANGFNGDGTAINRDPQRTPDSATPPQSYTPYIIGTIVLLVGLEFAMRKMTDNKPDPSIVGVNVWNFVVIAIMATLGSFAMKVIFNKYPVKGLTDVVNAS